MQSERERRTKNSSTRALYAFNNTTDTHSTEEEKKESKEGLLCLFNTTCILFPNNEWSFYIFCGRAKQFERLVSKLQVSVFVTMLEQNKNISFVFYLPRTAIDVVVHLICRSVLFLRASKSTTQPMYSNVQKRPNVLRRKNSYAISIRVLPRFEYFSMRFDNKSTGNSTNNKNSHNLQKKYSKHKTNLCLKRSPICLFF